MKDLNAIRMQVLEEVIRLALAWAEQDPLSDRDLELVAVLGRSDASLEDVARVWDHVLLGSGHTFARVCEVPSFGRPGAPTFTAAAQLRLRSINRGRPFTYVWSS